VPTALTNTFARITYDDGHLFLTDIDSQRVLRFVGIPSNDNEAADLAYGQPATFTTLRGLGPDRLQRPGSLSIDDGKMLIVDRDNARVLLWDTLPDDGTTPADRVLGQVGFTTNTTSCSASTLGGADDGVWVAGKLIVADSTNTACSSGTAGRPVTASPPTSCWASRTSPTAPSTTATATASPTPRPRPPRCTVLAVSRSPRTRCSLAMPATIVCWSTAARPARRTAGSTNTRPARARASPTRAA